MTFNINEFRSTIDAHGGVDRSTQFEVIITPPSFLSSKGIASDLRFFALSAQIPSVGLQTSQVYHNGYGVQEKRPYTSIFEDFPVTFVVDSNGEVIDFFKEWVTFINPFMIEGGDERDKFRFPNEYSTTIDFRKYKSSGEHTYTYKLHQAYPVAIGSVPVDWEQQNIVTRLPVNFAYHSWTYATT